VPWLKAGDNAATHPIVMRAASLVRNGLDQVLERDVIVNELFGFMVRCALQSAGHTTDYIIDEGTMWMLGGARTERLIELARKAGWVTKTRHANLQAWKLVDDPEFLHIRLAAEIEWERRQRADSSNPALTVPARLRDGDACRYCAKVVTFGSRKGPRAAAYSRASFDHRTPGKGASTPDELVVACSACNSSRKDDPEADQRMPLLPAPRSPLYSAATATFLANHGVTVTPTEDLRPGTFPGTAPGDPAASETTPPPLIERAPVSHTAAAGSADTADRLPTKSGFAGSGRVGTGSSAVTQPSTAGTRDSPLRPRRSRRGRGRPRTGGTR
jgi:5-methylcytosine-specific restriction endonuclease McrA